MSARSLTDKLKDKLIQQTLEHKLKNAAATTQVKSVNPLQFTSEKPAIPEHWCRFDKQPNFLQMQIIQKGGEKFGLDNPFFRVHDQLAGATTENCRHPVY